MKFINPYNFFPLEGKVSKEQIKENEKKYTGFFEVSLLTKTPLVIPDTSDSNAFGKQKEHSEHKNYKFFSYKEDDRPVIPGSEIRGMIRSNYEIITNSCMSSLDTDNLMYKRTKERFKCGLIKKINNETYELYSATDYLFRTEGKNNLNADCGTWDRNCQEGRSKHDRKCYIQNKLKEGQKVSFDFFERNQGKPIVRAVSEGESEGYIIKGCKGPNKHCLHIFANPEKLEMELTTEDIKNLKNNLKIYKKTKSAYDEYEKSLDTFLNQNEQEYFPVYYSKITSQNKTKVYLSPACITREVYNKTIGDCVGDFAPCKKEDELCEACSLFGRVFDSTSGSFSKASRVRVSDFVCDDSDSYYMEPITLQPLSSPKLNNMEFYLKKPNGAKFWTYDYYVNDQGTIVLETGMVNGRKFYWHNMNYQQQNDTPSNQNTTVQPARKDLVFKGKVYFSDISEDELIKLKFILNAGDESEELTNKNHGYKLGHAKPLGFGSVAIKVDNTKTVKIEKNGNDIKINMGDPGISQAPKIDGKLEEQFKNMTSFTPFNELEEYSVSYPRADGRNEIFHWFSQNHGEAMGPGRRKDEIFKEFMSPMMPVLKNVGKSNIKQINDDNGESQRQIVTERTVPVIENTENLPSSNKKQPEVGKEYIGKFVENIGKKRKYKIEDLGNYPKFNNTELENIQDNEDIVVKYEGEIEGKPKYTVVRKA